MIKVMLADDSAVIRSYIKEKLESEGDIAVTVECSDVKSATLLYNKELCDVVLMDIEMAECDYVIQAA